MALFNKGDLCVYMKTAVYMNMNTHSFSIRLYCIDDTNKKVGITCIIYLCLYACTDFIATKNECSEVEGETVHVCSRHTEKMVKQQNKRYSVKEKYTTNTYPLAAVVQTPNTILHRMNELIENVHIRIVLLFTIIAPEKKVNFFLLI